jgi:uncharacterized protein YprB with RNaseH-like and TPR domain
VVTTIRGVAALAVDRNLTFLATSIAFYAANATRYAAYGVIGAVLLFVTWLYFASAVVLLGGAVNAVLGEATPQTARVLMAAHGRVAVRIENSFIPAEGVGETTERRLWEAGVTTWADFDGDVVGDRTAARIHDFVDTARTRLHEGDTRYFRETFPSGTHWRCYEDFRDETCFLDIETTGLNQRRDDVTVVSCHRGGETTTLVADRDLTAGRLQRELDAAKLLVTFNGKRFDVPFLETAFDVSVEAPHVDLMYPCRRLGLTGGLKPIEREVGIDRDRPDLSGEDAVRLWREYRRGDQAALETLVSYNRDDTVNMRTLMELVTDRLEPDPLA